jgi:hypothetical protein
MPKNKLIICLLVVMIPSLVGAYETDQVNNRLEPVLDAAPAMNRQVNLAIASAITGMKGKRNEKKVVAAVFKRLGSKHWVDKIERWTMESNEIERVNTPADSTIYSGHPMWATRVAGMTGVGATLSLNHTFVGSDKFGHFFSQGLKFYKRWLKSRDESKAAEHSAYTERAIFGQMTTGSYSNADLVANYEGYLFYRSLFEDDVLNNKPAILAWKQDHWIMQRPFDWADHINEYWDEALNINYYDKLLYPFMEARFLTFCDDYFAYPELYSIPDEETLKRRYKDLQLHDSSELRLSNLCVNELQDQTDPSKITVSTK